MGATWRTRLRAGEQRQRWTARWGDALCDPVLWLVVIGGGSVCLLLLGTWMDSFQEQAPSRTCSTVVDGPTVINTSGSSRSYLWEVTGTPQQLVVPLSDSYRQIRIDWKQVPTVGQPICVQKVDRLAENTTYYTVTSNREILPPLS